MGAFATTRLLLPWLGAALVAVPLPLRAEAIIRCESHGMGYRCCPVDTGDRVELVRGHGIFDCKQNRSWGYDCHGVWVDHGCKGEFRVGRSHSGRDKAMVGALVGLAALAAIASIRQKQEHAQEEVSSWAILQRLRLQRALAGRGDRAARRLVQGHAAGGGALSLPRRALGQRLRRHRRARSRPPGHVPALRQRLLRIRR